MSTSRTADPSVQQLCTRLRDLADLLSTSSDDYDWRRLTQRVDEDLAPHAAKAFTLLATYRAAPAAEPQGGGAPTVGATGALPPASRVAKARDDFLAALSPAVPAPSPAAASAGAGARPYQYRPTQSPAPVPDTAPAGAQLPARQYRYESPVQVRPMSPLPRQASVPCPAASVPQTAPAVSSIPPARATPPRRDAVGTAQYRSLVSPGLSTADRFGKQCKSESPAAPSYPPLPTESPRSSPFLRHLPLPTPVPSHTPVSAATAPAPGHHGSPARGVSPALSFAQPLPPAVPSPRLQTSSPVTVSPALPPAVTPQPTVRLTPLLASAPAPESAGFAGEEPAMLAAPAPAAPLLGAAAVRDALAKGGLRYVLDGNGVSRVHAFFLATPRHTATIRTSLCPKGSQQRRSCTGKTVEPSRPWVSTRRYECDAKARKSYPPSTLQIQTQVLTLIRDYWVETAAFHRMA